MQPNIAFKSAQTLKMSPISSYLNHKTKKEIKKHLHKLVQLKASTGARLETKP